MASTLEELLGAGLARALRDISEPEVWPSALAIERELDRWAAAGVPVLGLGRSLEGRQIRAACFSLGKEPKRTALAWGYPHPDEPIGAAGLLALGRLALAGKLSGLQDWRLVLVPCADPDQVSRQLWLEGDGSAKAWAEGVWRPTRLGLEADYGFPIDWPPFLQSVDYEGACHTAAECAERCGGPPCRNEGKPYRVLPESLALARAIDLFRPELVASMHSTHTSGDYTFLLEREKPGVLDDLIEIPAAVGCGRHLGEAIDRGRRWRRDAPDLIRELTLENRKKMLERKPGYQDGFLYAGNAAAAAYIEALPWKAQFVCPETALFRHPAFSDPSPTETRIEVLRGNEKRPAGDYLTLRFEDDGQWVIGQQQPDPGKMTPTLEEVYAPRSILGVRALLRRRRVFHQADLIWESVRDLPGLRPHLYGQERPKIDVPGAYVADGSMRIFRSREDYRRRATVAQEASFEWIWPLHSVLLLGNLRNWLASQDEDRPEIQQAIRRARELSEAELAAVHPSLRKESPRAPALRSQLARVIRLMLVEARN